MRHCVYRRCQSGAWAIGVRLWVVLLFGCWMLDVGPVDARDWSQPKYQLQKRRNVDGEYDRQEGIRPLQISAGATLTLVAAFLRTPTLRGRTPVQTYRLGFFLPQDEGRVILKVRDYNVFKEAHYWMLPLRNKYRGGFHEFSWAAGLSWDLGVRQKDLGATALLGGHSRDVIAPFLLHTARFPARIQVHGCRFAFVPNADMTVTYRLYPKGNAANVMVESPPRTWYKGERQQVIWHGKDRLGQPARAGRYVLDVTPGAAEIPDEYEFYYQPVIVP